MEPTNKPGASKRRAFLQILVQLSRKTLEQSGIRLRFGEASPRTFSAAHGVRASLFPDFMKYKVLYPLLWLALAIMPRAADRVTITVTITNAPSAADTITVNAATRTWRSSVTAPATEILVGADAGASATNLFRQFSAYALAGPVILGFSSTNVITIQGQSGQAMSASLSAAYGTVSYSTNTVTSMYMVRVPMSGEPAVPQTNNATLLATGMGTYSQSPFAAGTTLLDNIVQTSGNQTIAGSKDLTGTTKFRSALFVSNTLPTIVFYDSNAGTDAKFATITSEELGFVVSFEDDSYANPNNVLHITRNGQNADSITFGGPVLSGGLITTGTNLFSRVNHTALANGNNAGVNFGSATYVKVKAGPTAAFAICGIVGGSNGRELLIHNSTSQNMTISHDSGVDPTAANRIYTYTGSDVATTGNGFASLIYDSEDSRWILKYASQ